MKATPKEVYNQLNSHLGSQIKKSRLLMGVGQKEIATYSRMSQSQYSKFEGHKSEVKAVQFFLMCDALEINMSHIQNDIKKMT